MLFEVRKCTAEVVMEVERSCCDWQQIKLLVKYLYNKQAADPNRYLQTSPTSNKKNIISE